MWEAELRDALDAVRIPPVAFEVRGMGFMDGGADVRAFHRAFGRQNQARLRRTPGVENVRRD